MMLVVQIPLYLRCASYSSLSNRLKVLYPVHPNPNFTFFVIVCTDGRDTVGSANKGMKVFDMGQFDFS